MTDTAPDYNQRQSTPVPDPTVLTTEALQREILALRQLLDQRISALRELLENELDGNKNVCEEKFTSIDKELELIERQRVEQKKDTKDAVDAALSAAKEAVKEQTTASEARTDKSEASTTKSIEQLAETFNTAFDGIGRQVSDLKERVATLDQVRAGQRESVTEHRANTQPFQVAIVSALSGGTVGLIAAVILAASTGGP